MKTHRNRYFYQNLARKKGYFYPKIDGSTYYVVKQLINKGIVEKDRQGKLVTKILLQQ
jgi:hypothetical protein